MKLTTLTLTHFFGAALAFMSAFQTSSFAQTQTLEVAAQSFPVIGSLDVDYSRIAQQVSGLNHHRLTGTEKSQAQAQFGIQNGEPTALVGIYYQINDTGGGKQKGYLWLGKVNSPNAQKVVQELKPMIASGESHLRPVLDQYLAKRQSELETQVASSAPQGNGKTIVNPVAVPAHVQATLNSRNSSHSSGQPYTGMSTQTTSSQNSTANSSGTFINMPTARTPGQPGAPAPQAAPAAQTPATPAVTANIELLIFGQDFCGYCRDLKAYIPELQNRFGSALKIQYIDSKAQPALAQKHNANSIPTVIILKDGAEVEHVDGSPGRPGLLRMLENYLRN
jgi:thiol-disulfide isomerase/thioredoxin